MYLFGDLLFAVAIFRAFAGRVVISGCVSSPVGIVILDSPIIQPHRFYLTSSVFISPT
jgi:hypothetical protein